MTAASRCWTAFVRTTYLYDVQNRLVGALDQASNTIFAASYDYRTRRLTTTENGVSKYFRYDGGLSFQEITGGTTPVVDAEFVRGDDLGGGIGGILYKDTLSASPLPLTEFFSYSQVGHTVALTDSTGAVAKSDLYEAYGKVIASSGASGNNRLANTKERSFTLGLDNHGHRYFDPEVGRYISLDPLGYEDGPNPYLYTANNPINRVDADGQIWSLVVTAAFQAYDTFLWRTGKISNGDYAARSTINAIAFAADLASGGMGGGLAVRAGQGGLAALRLVRTASTAQLATRAVVMAAGHAAVRTEMTAMAKSGADDHPEGGGNQPEPSVQSSDREVKAEFRAPKKPSASGTVEGWPRPGRPTGRDWAAEFREKYGRENVEWGSLKQLRNQWQKNKETIIKAWEDAHGKKWPKTSDGQQYVPHHDPALSEGGSIWDITPKDPAAHAQEHAGGKTVKPTNPFER